MRVPVFIPRFARQRFNEDDCDCKKRPVDMEYKSALLTWLVDVGCDVQKGQSLCEAEVEKAVIEIPSPCSGLLAEICVEEGVECDMYTVIAFIEEA